MNPDLANLYNLIKAGKNRSDEALELCIKILESYTKGRSVSDKDILQFTQHMKRQMVGMLLELYCLDSGER